MSNKPPPGLNENDFDSIEDAVMETARGRWFLREFARRARAADTGRLLDALSRIERVVCGQSALPGGFAPERHALALDERHSRFAEIAWTLRERGYDGSICTLIENEARALASLAEGVRGAGPLAGAEAARALPAPAAAPKPVPAPLAVAAPVVLKPAPAPPPARYEAPPLTRDRRLEALAVLDRLAPREKAALFA